MISIFVLTGVEKKAHSGKLKRIKLIPWLVLKLEISYIFISICPSMYVCVCTHVYIKTDTLPGMVHLPSSGPLPEAC